MYLKKGSRIKKVCVDHINMNTLQELFRDKLNCNTQLIYILDPESNIEYELEQVSDIKPYSVLSVRGEFFYIKIHTHTHKYLIYSYR